MTASGPGCVKTEKGPPEIAFKYSNNSIEAIRPLMGRYR